MCFVYFFVFLCVFYVFFVFWTWPLARWYVFPPVQSIISNEVSSIHLHSIETKYDESKFLFQRDIVFNPKEAASYLYLAKIFKIEENLKEEEKNLNTTLLLDPKNEEAIYLLMDIEIERSNFAKVKDLKENFEKVCSKLCPKISSINEKLKNFDTQNES